MTSEERVERVFRGEAPDRVPFDTPAFFTQFRQNWAEYMGLQPESLADHYGLDVSEVVAEHSPKPSLKRVIKETPEETISVDGFDAFCCLEPRAGSDIVELRETLGEEIVFFGSMCNTVVLPKGSKEEIRAAVLKQMRLARRGRCIVGPTHSVSDEVPAENLDYMFKLIQEWAPWDAPLPEE